MINYETAKQRCQQLQENTDSLEHQASEDTHAVTQEDTVDSEQEIKEDTNLENNPCHTDNELREIKDELLALVCMFVIYSVVILMCVCNYVGKL